MHPQLKFGCEWKAIDGDPGELDGYMSVFGNVDQGGDVVMPGAFRKTFADWSRAKTPMPLIADHELSTDGVIGSVVKATEDSHGARVRARFSSIQKAQDIRTKMIEGHLAGMSFTYEPVGHHRGQKDGREVRFLTEIKVFEATVTPFPMNQLAIASAKVDDEKVSAYASASKPYGDVSYADPGYLDSAGNQARTSGNTPQARYPIDTEAHCRAAWSYFHQGNNAAAYTTSQRSTVEGRIRSALREYGVDVASSSFDFETLESVVIGLRGVPDVSFRKTVFDLTIAHYQHDLAAGQTDELSTATAAVDTDTSAVDTADVTGAEYALSLLPGPRDDAPDGEPRNTLAYPSHLLEMADLDALEAKIVNDLGETAP
jgi:HK97 family phage prohead protease